MASESICRQDRSEGGQSFSLDNAENRVSLGMEVPFMGKKPAWATSKSIENGRDVRCGIPRTPFS